jgi:hypothetical protein
MTVSVLELEEDETKIEKVNKILENLNPQFQEIAQGKLIFNFEKFQAIGQQTDSRVIFASMKKDENFEKIQEIIHLIIDALVTNKILNQEQLNNNHIKLINGKYSTLIHLTLLNVTFLNKILKKNGEKEIFKTDLTSILNFMNKNCQLNDCELKEINFSKMREDPITQKYTMLNSYSI